MARPPLRIGQTGKVSIQETSPGRFRARCRIRDKDGIVRQVAKFGGSEDEARKELDEELRRRRPPTSAIRGDSRVRDVAKRWIDRVKLDEDRALSTRERYAWVVERIIEPRIGALLVRECTVARLDDFIDDVRRDHGIATARTTRTCLGMVLATAVKHGALESNPVRDLSRLPKTSTPARSLSSGDVAKLLGAMRTDRLTREHDLLDLTRFMLGSGCRLGEACALRVEDIDFTDGVASIHATQTHRGRQESTKSAAGRRVIPLPADVLLMLRDRIDDPSVPTDVALFASPLGRPRDPSNTTSHLRRAFDRAGFPWVHSHTLRKTAATRMDDAGLTARQIADHLGHQRISMTQDVYMGRKVASSRAAEVLANPLQ